MAGESITNLFGGGNKVIKFGIWKTEFKYYVIKIIWSRTLSVLTAIFSGKPGLVGFIGAKDDGGGEW